MLELAGSSTVELRGAVVLVDSELVISAVLVPRVVASSAVDVVAERVLVDGSRLELLG